MSLFSNILAWFKHIMHLDQHGLLPPAPTNGESVTLPAAPPLPAPSPAPPALPVGVLAFEDAPRKFVKLADIEAIRATDPRWAKAPTWWAIELEDESQVSFEARSNLIEAKSLMMGGADIKVDASCVNTAYAMTQTDPGKSFGYARGTPYNDALSFIGDNVVNGIVTYRGLRPSDIKQFIANCNANYDRDLAAGVDPERLKGDLPVIDHTPAG